MHDHVLDVSHPEALAQVGSVHDSQALRLRIPQPCDYLHTHTRLSMSHVVHDNDDDDDNAMFASIVEKKLLTVLSTY